MLEAMRLEAMGFFTNEPRIFRIAPFMYFFTGI